MNGVHMNLPSLTDIGIKSRGHRDCRGHTDLKVQTNRGTATHVGRPGWLVSIGIHGETVAVGIGGPGVPAALMDRRNMPPPPFPFGLLHNEPVNPERRISEPWLMYRIDVVLGL